jgi:hypothetical protein
MCYLVFKECEFERTIETISLKFVEKEWETVVSQKTCHTYVMSFYVNNDMTHLSFEENSYTFICTLNILQCLCKG